MVNEIISDCAKLDCTGCTSDELFIMALPFMRNFWHFDVRKCENIFNRMTPEEQRDLVVFSCTIYTCLECARAIMDVVTDKEKKK